MKEIANEIAEPVTIIMNLALRDGIPDDWKLAIVTPIYKKGAKSSPGNYRPVSLTCVLCKVQESIIRDNIIKHLVQNDLISDKQHGFIAGRSCTTNLLEVIDIWSKYLENDFCIDSIYLDFAKAFDSVPHVRLLQKISAYGIKGKDLKWISTFLSGRWQKVVVKGEESEWREVLSGVPQGSVLGPILFVLYVNDMPEMVNSHLSLFADDAKLFNTTINSNVIQEDLTSLEQWSAKWQLRFNADKCKVLHIGNNNDKRSDYTMSSGDSITQLDTVDSEKDLGIHVDNKLKFQSHVEKQCKKANRILGLIRRSFTHLDVSTLPHLYKALVRPHLEYGASVFYPRYKGCQDNLEKVQRRATKLVPGLENKDYDERLKSLDMPSLHYRRARGDMIECYKYLTGKYKVKNSMFEVDSSNTRGHSLKLRKSGTAQNSVRHNFFSVRCINSWNSLSEEIVASQSLNDFKNSLDNYWKQYKYVSNSDWYLNPRLNKTDKI